MVKIICSNIRFDNPADKNHRWAVRLPLLAKIVNDYQPAILCTQEGRQPQLLELEDSLEKLILIDNHREWIDERMYPCIYVNYELIDILDSGDIWLSETPDIPGSFSFGSAFPRLCTWAKVHIKKEDSKFLLINTHLDHLHSETRVEQMNVLTKEIKKINSSNLPCIICGDFNESPEGEVRKSLMAAMPDIFDPWQINNSPEESTFHKFKGYLALDEGGARIDWILADKCFKNVNCCIEKYSEEGTWPSDHFPIKAEFKP